MIENSRPADAKNYYSTADYYSEGQELVGYWRGSGAERLGLEGAIEKADWDALCDNRHPETGGALTARQKQNRRVGYDFNFHVPKSVSVLYGITGDERILAAFRESVADTMRDIESEMQTRVRSGGRNEDRTTGNMVWGEFVHTTARPVEGIPDPHLHAHCFAFNVTWDETESRWKAGQFAGLKRDAPYFEAVFHSRFARKLQELGLPVERTRKSWELADIPRSALRRFSRRTAEIEAIAEQEGIVDPDAKGELGARTRSRKRRNLTIGELRREWTARMSDGERAAVEQVARRVGGDALPTDERTTAAAVAAAIDHCLERSSVVAERKLTTEALRRSYGAGTERMVADRLAGSALITGRKDEQTLVTTERVLAEEQRLVAFARDGRGTRRPLLASEHAFRRDWLNAGQRGAVRHVLDSRDRVTLVRGAAGVGKTTMMREAIEAAEAAGTRVFVFAPSADASYAVLRDAEGFKDAETVAQLLRNRSLQERVRGQALWIDEAGLLGTRTVAELFDLARELDARVILSGDRKQHGSVERGAALRLLEEEAGLAATEITEIQRQKGAYKEAVAALADGDAAAGFRALDRLGWIKEVPADRRHAALAADYAETVESGKTALVVSPTHREGERITEAIRARLQQDGRVSRDERAISVLTNLNMTEAERADAVNYLPGDVLVFHQNAKGFKRGQRVIVGTGKLPLSQAARFQVFRAGHLKVAAGDVLRVTRNGTTADGRHRLNNGQLVTVRSVNAKGDLTLANGWTVAHDFGHLAHGYVVTSHASQGKTVDRVFIGQSAMSMGAASREQFYVSVSRGRQQAVIYTDDKLALLDAVTRSDARITATELARASRMARRQQRKARLMQPQHEAVPERARDHVR